MSPLNRALYIPSIGSVISMTLGVVLITLSFIHWLVMHLVPMEPLLMPPVSQRCPSLYIESMLPSFSHHMSLCSCSKEVETCVGHSSVILTLHVGHSRYSYWLVHLWLSPSTLYSFAEYLVLDDGGFLNTLLPTDFIPSSSDHLV